MIETSTYPLNGFGQRSNTYGYHFTLGRSLSAWLSDFCPISQYSYYGECTLSSDGKIESKTEKRNRRPSPRKPDKIKREHPLSFYLLSLFIQSKTLYQISFNSPFDSRYAPSIQLNIRSSWVTTIKAIPNSSFSSPIRA